MKGEHAMNEFLKKVDGFFVENKKDVEFVIDGKKVTYSVPYFLRSGRGKAVLIVGEEEIPVTDDNIREFFEGNHDFIVNGCREHIWKKITRDAKK